MNLGKRQSALDDGGGGFQSYGQHAWQYSPLPVQQQPFQHVESSPLHRQTQQKYHLHQQQYSQHPAQVSTLKSQLYGGFTSHFYTWALVCVLKPKP
jgi:hypothetical protein